MGELFLRCFLQNQGFMNLPYLLTCITDLIFPIFALPIFQTHFCGAAFKQLLMNHELLRVGLTQEFV